MTLLRASLLALPAVLALQSDRVTFDAPRDYYVESHAVVTGDVNGDGSLDVVAGTHNISLMLGRPDGVLQAPRLIAGGSTPVAQMVLADFNGDAHLDLAAALYSDPGRVVVRLGVGDGTFTPPTDYPLASPPTDLTIGDFNGDGILDLATANPHLGGGSLLTGDGSGTFAAVSIALTGVPTKVRSADFDGDSTDDLLVYDIAADTDVLRVFLSDGTGAFLLASTVDVGTNFRDSLPGPPADYDTDGTVDLVVYGNFGVHLFRGAGDGTFPTRAQIFAGDVDQVAVADFDGDLKADIAALRAFGANVTVLSGNDDGTFAMTVSNSLGKAGATGLLAANFNQDARMDLVLADFNLAMLQVRMGNGDGTFVTPRIIEDRALVNGTVNWVVAADFNRDGAMDTASSQGGTTSWLSVLPGNGDGSFRLPIDMPVPEATEVGTSADVNGDANPDLILISRETFSSTLNDVWVYLGNGDGTFQPGVAYATGDKPWMAAVADFTGDAIPDIAVTNRGGLRPFGSPSSIVMLTGLGGGNFGPAVEIARAVSAGSVVTTDFNGDLAPDLAVTQGTNVAAYPSAVGIYLNNGTGSFTASYIPIPEPWRLGHLTAADTNGDGDADLLAIGTQATQHLRSLVVSLVGRGDGTFTGAGASVVGGSAVTPLAIDLDGDGSLDVAVGAFSAMHVLTGNGDGTFTPVGNFSVDGDWVTDAAAADFNGDAKPDLAVVNEVRHYREDGAVLSVKVIRLLTNTSPAVSP
jgi:hypothetical protein